MSTDTHVDQCQTPLHLRNHCNACKRFEQCSFIYNLEYAEADCSANEELLFHNAYNLFYTNVYDKGMDATKRLKWCDITNSTIGQDAEMSMTLYSVYGPSCDIGERFQVYQSPSKTPANGFCYCGSTCDKTYSNPLLDYLLSILIGLMFIHIMFNFGKYWRYSMLNASSSRKSYKAVVPGKTTRRIFNNAVRRQQDIDRDGWRKMRVEPGIPLPLSSGGGLAQRVAGS